MSKIIWIIRLSMSCAAALLLVTACTPSVKTDPLTTEERAWLREHDGTIVLGHDPSASPVDFTDEDGVFRGLAADYTHLIEQKLGFKFDVVNIETWDEVLQQFLGKKIDVMCAFARSPVREQFAYFTNPYIQIPIVILTRDDGPRTLALDDMEAMRITFTKGWIVDDLLRTEYEDYSFVPAINPDAAMNNLSTAAADAWITALTVASEEIQKSKITNLRVAGETAYTFDLAFASRNDWPILNSILQKGLNLITPREREGIFEKWIYLESGTSIRARRFFLALLVAVAMSAFAVVFVFIWNKSLKHQVQQRTHELKVSESRHREMIAGISDVIAILSTDGTILYKSPNVERWFGWKPEDLVGTDGWKTVHPEDIARVQREFGEILHSEGAVATVEYRYKCADGDYKWIELSATNLLHNPDIHGFLTNYRDISERKAAEQALKERTDFIDRIIESSAVGTWITDEHGTAIRANPACLEFLGITSPEMIGTHNLFSDAFLKRAGAVPAVEEVFRTGRPASIVFEYGDSVDIEATPQNAGRKTVHGIFTPIVDGTGQITNVICQAVDLTEIRTAERALRQSEEKYKALIENLSETILILDEHGTATWSSPALRRYRDADEGSGGFSLVEITHPDDRAEVTGAIEAAVANPGTLTTLEGIQAESASDQTFYLDQSFVYLPDTPGIGGVVVTCRDATDRVTAELHRAGIEDKLRQSQKMEAIGTLAGGIAHDFNNMLGVIMGNLSYALTTFQPDESLREVLADIQESARFAQSLTQQLLTFAKGGAPIKKPVDMNALVKKSAKFATRGAETQCRFVTDDELWTAEVDEGQINQVIGNLVINANQAMPDGGAVTIRTQNALDEEVESETALQLGRYVKIEVEDTGDGIPRERFSKIFEPYYTTKQKGTGLGLATSYAIVRRHGGVITVWSEIGQGSRFKVFLPASSATHPTADPEVEAFHRGRGSILVLDDQIPIQRMLARMLESMGYDAKFAAEGKRAIEMYREAFESETPFEAVILDLTIPGGMGGMKVLPELKRLDPDVKALVSSGYSNDPIMAQFEEYGFRGVVPKPYSRGQLAKVLNTVMDPLST